MQKFPYYSYASNSNVAVLLWRGVKRGSKKRGSSQNKFNMSLKAHIRARTKMAFIGEVMGWNSSIGLTGGHGHGEDVGKINVNKIGNNEWRAEQLPYRQRDQREITGNVEGQGNISIYLALPFFFLLYSSQSKALPR